MAELARGGGSPATTYSRSRSITTSAGSRSASRACDRPVSSPHRAATLTTYKEAIDTLNGTVPLWKK